MMVKKDARQQGQQWRSRDKAKTGDLAVGLGIFREEGKFDVKNRKRSVWNVVDGGRAG